MNDEELSRLIQQGATRHTASEPLRAAVRTQIALQTARRPGPPVAAGPWRGWPALLGSFAAGAALSLALALALPPWLQRQQLPAELVAAHVRVLKTGPLIEVASSDRHTVKPWFQGKLDYAPPVPDLAADGFPLLGGRIERMAGAPVATLAYTAHQHMLSVYVWPDPATSPPQRGTQRGFMTLHWAEAGMQVWVVSDQDAAEIERFGRAWRAWAAAAAHP